MKKIENVSRGDSRRGSREGKKRDGLTIEGLDYRRSKLKLC